MVETAKVVFQGGRNASRYHPYAYLNTLLLKASAGVADLIITRAGSTLFEVAIWEKPAIVIPIPESISHDQTGNAFS